MSDLLSTPHTPSGRHSLLPVARDIAGLPTLSKQDQEQEEFLLDNAGLPFAAPPVATPGLIDPATFQQQMFNMMSLLTESIAGQRTRRENTSLSTREYGKEPKIKDPETFCHDPDHRHGGHAS